MTKYYIVKFPDENNDVSVVPSNWLSGETCYWPLSDKKIHKQIKRAEVPDSTWLTYKYSIIKEFGM